MCATNKHTAQQISPYITAKCELHANIEPMCSNMNMECMGVNYKK